MKIPKPRKLSSGNWFIQLRLNGVSVPVTAATETECIRLAELTKAQHRAGNTEIKKLPKDLTLREAMKRFIENSKSTLSPSTYDRYLVYTDCRFKDYLDRPLGQIKWQRMIDDELRKVSAKTVKNGWGLVTPSLKFVGYPVPSVRLAQVPVKETAFLQPEEIKPFCEAVKGRPYEIAALLMLHGLRLSEMKALTWADIGKNSIRVCGAYVKGHDGYVDKDTNKTTLSTRHVPIMIPQLTKALDKKRGKDEEKVVSITGSVLLRDVKRACERAGVTICGNHSLRHSFASLCFYLKIPLEQIQKWGGWEDDKTLKRIYIHLAASAEDDHQKSFSGFFK